MKKVMCLALTLSLCLAGIAFHATASAAQIDGGGGATTPIVPVPVSTTLSFAPADVVSNSDGSVLYLSDKAGKKVYSIDTETFEQKSISFDRMPESLYYKDGKLYVALCDRAHSAFWWTEEQTGAFAIVDATNLALVKENRIALDPYSIVVSNDGTVYIGSGSGQWTQMHSFQPDGKLREKVTSFDYQTKLRYNAQLNRIYGTDTTSSPRSMFAFPLKSDGTFVDTYFFTGKWPYHGSYSMGTTFFIAPDGAYIFNSSGNVFSCRADKAEDMKFKTSLNKSWSTLAFSPDGTKFYTALNNKQIYAYDYATFAGTATYESQGYPQFMFARGDTLVAVSKETAEGNRYLIERVDLSAPKTTIQITVTERPLLYEDGRAQLGIRANTKTVFNDTVMYIIDNLENALFVVDSGALTETKIIFPDTPNSLYYDNGELFVGFGGRGIVAVLDAQTFAVKEYLLLGTLFYDMAVGKDGFIYTIEFYGDPITSFSRTTGQQVSVSSAYPRGGKLVPHPTINMFYWADVGISPQDISALSYVNGVIGNTYDSPYHGDYPIGARIRLSPDGAHLFTSSGSVFRCSPLQEYDMSYLGKFLSFADLAFDLQNNRMVASGVGKNLYVYDYTTYEMLGFIKTVSPVKEMARTGNTILALSSENNSLFYLESVSLSDLLQVEAEEITLSSDDVLFLRSTDHVDLAPVLQYNDGTSKSIVNTAEYASSDETVATVSPSGRLQALARGDTTVTVTAEGVTKSIEVYVDFDLSSITVEGYEIGFSPYRTYYHVKLPAGTTEIPTVTYEAPDGVVVTVTDATEIPGETTLVITDAGQRFSKTYTIYFFAEDMPPAPDETQPYMLRGYYIPSDGFIHLYLEVLENPLYLGDIPHEYTVVVQLFSKEFEPISLSATANVRETYVSFSDQYMIAIAIVDRFGQEGYIGVPLAVPILIMM